MNFKNLTELQNSLENSESLKSEFLNDPLNFILKAKELHPIWNKKVFLTVVYFVGGALAISLIIAGIIVLGPAKVVDGPNGNPILLQKEVDNFFVMMGSAAIGALAGLLVPNPEK